MNDRILEGIWEGITRLEMLGVRKENLVISMSGIIRDSIAPNFNIGHPPSGIVLEKIYGVRVSTDFPYNDHILVFSPMDTTLNPKLLFRVEVKHKKVGVRFG